MGASTPNYYEAGAQAVTPYLRTPDSSAEGALRPASNVVI